MLLWSLDHKTESSSFAILASSRLPKRGESALRKHCVLRKFTKRLTETSASNWSQSSQGVWWNGSAQSKRQFVSRSGQFVSMHLWSFDHNIRCSGSWSGACGPPRQHCQFWRVTLSGLAGRPMAIHKYVRRGERAAERRHHGQQYCHRVEQRNNRFAPRASGISSPSRQRRAGEQGHTHPELDDESRVRTPGGRSS